MKKILGLLAAAWMLQASPAFSAVIQDWTSLGNGAAGPYNDNNGSKVEFTFDAGPKAGQKALKITTNLVSSGYAGVYTNTTGDLSKSANLVFMVKSSAAGDVQVAIKDAFNVQYVEKFTVPAGDWTPVTLSLAGLIKDPYFTPPDAIAGHPMDLSKISNLNFSPQMTGASVVLIGPIETMGTASTSSASSNSAAKPSSAAASSGSGSGLAVYDFTADTPTAGGVFNDSLGSTIKFTLVDNPNKKGSKYLKVDYDLKQGGYCGVYYRTGSGWDGQDWTVGNNLSMMVYSKAPITLGLAIKDKNNNQYTATAPATKGTGWEKIIVPLDSFTLGQYYTPPDAIKGAPKDLSAVKQLQFQPQTGGPNTFAIDSAMIVK